MNVAQTLPPWGLSPESLGMLLEDLGAPGYRADQILRWVYSRRVVDPRAMTDLPEDLRVRLAERLGGAPLTVSRRLDSRDGTRKLALALGDAELVEAVLIPDASKRLTLCVSSQVGCAMGCTFCATARLKLRRQLRTAEIVGQIQLARGELDTLDAGPEMLTNLVFMGMGEPLHNLDELLPALEILTSSWGLEISPRRITVSTVGLVPEMRRLLEETRVNLAVSLGATTEEKRRELMPITRKHSLRELLEACRNLPIPRRRRITFQYTLLEGQNESPEDARRLVSLLHGIPAKVNLIYWNPFDGAEFRPVSREKTEAFQRLLLDQGLHATIRESRGPDIDAACGQLAARGS
jgi:23S rRNA (adenine2503-C2)-methyltransferase